MNTCPRAGTSRSDSDKKNRKNSKRGVRETQPQPPQTSEEALNLNAYDAMSPRGEEIDDYIDEELGNPLTESVTSNIGETESVASSATTTSTIVSSKLMSRQASLTTATATAGGSEHYDDNGDDDVDVDFDGTAIGQRRFSLIAPTIDDVSDTITCERTTCGASSDARAKTTIEKIPKGNMTESEVVGGATSSSSPSSPLTPSSPLSPLSRVSKLTTTATIATKKITTTLRALTTSSSLSATSSSSASMAPPFNCRTNTNTITGAIKVANGNSNSGRSGGGGGVDGGDEVKSKKKSTENKCSSKELTKVSNQREVEAYGSERNVTDDHKREIELNIENVHQQHEKSIDGKKEHWKASESTSLSTKCEPLESTADTDTNTDTRLAHRELTSSATARILISSRNLAARKAQLKLDFFRQSQSQSQDGKAFESQQLKAVTPTPTPKTVLPQVIVSSECGSLVEQRKRQLERQFARQQAQHKDKVSSPASASAAHSRPSSPGFPSVGELVQKFDSSWTTHQRVKKKMIVPTSTPTPTNGGSSHLAVGAVSDSSSSNSNLLSLKPDMMHEHQRNSPLSDEGCNLGQSPYSSDNDNDNDNDNDDNESVRTTFTTIENRSHHKEKVARSASSDSALGLEVDDPMDGAPSVPPPPGSQQKRRMTLTVTDLPLRPALLPLAEPTALPDSPTPVDGQPSLPASVPSKVLLEERVVEIPEDPRPIGASGGVGSLSSSRRESAQSYFSDYPVSECGGIRYVRTPSVVVSDYSDDVMCGITLEEIEYFRAQRIGRRSSSLDTTGADKDGDLHSDISTTSSCSNLYYCGSTISALDGSECYVNGQRLRLERKASDCSTCSASGDEQSPPTAASIGSGVDSPIAASRRADTLGQDLADMLAGQHLSSKRPKKVGGVSDANEYENEKINIEN